MLTKVFDRINSAADKAYLAKCICNGDVCHCSHDDGQNSFHANNNKDQQMPTNVIANMSAAERKELAAKIEASAEHMTHAERAELIQALSAGLGVDVKAKQDTERKNQILANIHATANDTVGSGRKEFDYMANLLRTKGVRVPIDELVWKTAQEIDAIFASANLAPQYRVGAKRFFGRLVTGRV